MKPDIETIPVPTLPSAPQAAPAAPPQSPGQKPGVKSNPNYSWLNSAAPASKMTTGQKTLTGQ